MDMLLGQVGVLAIEHSLMVEVDAMPTGNASDSYPSAKFDSGSTNPPPSPKFGADSTNPPPNPKLTSDTANPPPNPK
jgi:hypothetical protein